MAIESDQKETNGTQCKQGWVWTISDGKKSIYIAYSAERRNSKANIL